MYRSSLIAHCLLDSHNFKISSNMYFSNVLKFHTTLFTQISNSGKGTGYWKGYVGQRLINS